MTWSSLSKQLRAGPAPVGGNWKKRSALAETVSPSCSKRPYLSLARKAGFRSHDFGASWVAWHDSGPCQTVPCHPVGPEFRKDSAGIELMNERQKASLPGTRRQEGRNSPLLAFLREKASKSCVFNSASRLSQPMHRTEHGQ